MLNSLIIEGKIRKVNPLIDLSDGVTYEVFEVEVEHWYKDKDGENHREVSVFSVRASGKFAEVAKEHAKIGRGVRVVGRLVQRRFEDFSEIFIAAEHIEFGPM